MPLLTYFFKNTIKRVLVVCKRNPIFVSVFHRILDFKTGLYFYAGPFFMPIPPGLHTIISSHRLIYRNNYHAGTNSLDLRRVLLLIYKSFVAHTSSEAGYFPCSVPGKCQIVSCCAGFVICTIPYKLSGIA